MDRQVAISSFFCGRGGGQGTWGLGVLPRGPTREKGAHLACFLLVLQGYLDMLLPTLHVVRRAQDVLLDAVNHLPLPGGESSGGGPSSSCLPPTLPDDSPSSKLHTNGVLQVDGTGHKPTLPPGLGPPLSPVPVAWLPRLIQPVFAGVTQGPSGVLSLADCESAVPHQPLRTHPFLQALPIPDSPWHCQVLMCQRKFPPRDCQGQCPQLGAGSPLILSNQDQGPPPTPGAGCGATLEVAAWWTPGERRGRGQELEGGTT